LYLLEQHGESFKIWSASIRINTEGKSMIMKLGPELESSSDFIHCHMYIFVRPNTTNNTAIK